MIMKTTGQGMEPETVKFAQMRPEVHHSNYTSVKLGQSWGPRVIPDYEFILIVSGVFSYAKEGEAELELSQGDVLCIPPGVTHTFSCLRRSLGEAAFSCIHMEFAEGRSRLAGDYRPEIEPPLLTQLGAGSAMHLLFKSLSDTLSGYGSRRHEIAPCILKEIVLRLAELWEGKSASCVSPRVKAMAESVCADLGARVGRRELSKAFGISQEYVDTLFRRELGMTPTEYLHAQRSAKACKLLLEDGLSVKEAASLLGYSDEFHFSKMFKRHMGMAPSRAMPRKPKRLK